MNINITNWDVVTTKDGKKQPVFFFNPPVKFNKSSGEMISFTIKGTELYDIATVGELREENNSWFIVMTYFWNGYPKMNGTFILDEELGGGEPTFKNEFFVNKDSLIRIVILLLLLYLIIKYLKN